MERNWMSIWWKRLDFKQNNKNITLNILFFSEKEIRKKFEIGMLREIDILIKIFVILYFNI